VSSGKILIVDDSENIRSVLQMNFEYLGYEVLSAGDGEQALDLIEAESPDVVILDVMMPRQNGFQVCRKIKTSPRHSRIPVIFLTAKGQKEDRYWGKDCGADEYLTKPFSAAELERAIERLMDRRDRTLNMLDFDAELSSRLDAGEELCVLTVTFDPTALNTFRQKYGEFKFREALDSVRQTLELIVREEVGEACVGVNAEQIMRAILPGEEERAATLRDRIVAQSNLLLKSFYDQEDAGRGYVLARSGPDGDESHVPLLQVEAALQQ